MLVYLGNDLGGHPTSASDKEAITALCSGGAFIGAIIAGLTADQYGRKIAIYVGCVLFTVGAILQGASYGVGQMVAGRLIVGFGVGLVMSSCTAWASDLKGPAGAAVAGAVLTAGFAIGPFAGGAIALAGPIGIPVSFSVATAILVLATAIAVVAARRATPTSAQSVKATQPVGEAPPWRQGSARALSWVLPL